MAGSGGDGSPAGADCACGAGAPAPQLVDRASGRSLAGLGAALAVSARVLCGFETGAPPPFRGQRLRPHCAGMRIASRHYLLCSGASLPPMLMPARPPERPLTVPGGSVGTVAARFG